MKFVAARPFADPDAAARKLVEIANTTEPVQDGRDVVPPPHITRLFLLRNRIGSRFSATPPSAH